MKKKVSILAVSLMLISTVAFAATSFTDVKKSHWHYDFVMKAAEMGIIDGYTDGTFRPNEAVTRAQLAKIMVQYDKKAVDRIAEEDTIISVVSKSVPATVRIDSDENEGSGFFARESYILTNAHVVGNSKTVDVTLSTGQKIKGTVTNRDPAKDIAIVQVDGKYNYLKFAKSVTVGQTSVAIGSPLGMDFSVSKGIVSKLDVRDFTAAKMIQTDTAINSGNSGGVLINSKGETLGMVTGKLQGVVNPIEGMAYAIHFDELERYLKIYGK